MDTIWQHEVNNCISIDGKGVMARREEMIPPIRPLASNNQRVVRGRDDESLEQTLNRQGDNSTSHPSRPDVLISGPSSISNEVKGRCQAC